MWNGFKNINFEKPVIHSPCIFPLGDIFSKRYVSEENRARAVLSRAVLL